MANLADILAALGKLYLGAKAVSAGLGDLRAASPPLPKLGKPKIKLKRVNGLEGMMREIMAKAKQGSVDPRVRQLAVKVLSRKCGREANGRTKWCTPEKDASAEIRTLFGYVKNEVRYVHDIWSVDTYQHPLRTLEMHGGDCDDVSILIASLFLTVGYEVKFRVIRSVGSDDWNHILVMVGVPPGRVTKWIPLDASVKHEAGWYPPNHIIAATRDFPMR